MDKKNLKYKIEKNKIISPKFRTIYLKFRSIFGQKIINKLYRKQKAIFVHIPKAAGRSVSGVIFGDAKPGHYYITDYYNESREEFDGFFKFTFVREPLDRLNSSYHYLISGGGNEVDKIFGERLKRETKNFEDFVINWLDESKIYSWIHFVPQYKYITMRGSVAVDYIGKFENIESDFSYICEKLNINKDLEHRNKGKIDKNNNYSNEVKVKIKKLYNKDYDLLGY